MQICDFGLAKWKQQAATQTTTGHRRGTVAYMAPEVFKDPNVARTTKYDVYSFGIVFWELLTGQQPYEYGNAYKYGNAYEYGNEIMQLSSVDMYAQK